MNETPVLLIVIASVLTSNILLSSFLGMCSFLACSRQLGTAVGLGAAVTFVMTCTTTLNFAIYHYMLKKGALTWVFGSAAAEWDMSFLAFIVFIAVIAAFVQFVEMFVERFSPKLYYALGIFLPLITVNCAILGAALFMVIRSYTLAQSVGFGFGAGVGWWLAIVLMAGLRKKMGYSNVPRAFRGVAIAMLITGVMAMAFMGFAGMVPIQ
ncbi:MAG: NADH:ubiquinone reductase (Na(+)-transporting) subunit E [Planctomycetota bacterium]